MLSQLKNVQIDRMDLEEMVALSVFGKGLISEYDANALVAPDWLTENVGVLQKEIKARRRDNLERALKMANQKRSELRTAEEKRKDLDVEIERLQKELA